MDDAALPRIVYIAGAGRSGSTLLDTLLGNHPLAFGAGELAGLFKDWAAGLSCTCGRSYPECEFWGKVIERLQTARPGLAPADAEKLTRRVEALSARWPAGVNSSSLAQQDYRELWRTTLAAIKEVSGSELVIDSSKNSRPSWWRIWALKELCGLQVSVVHLVRDPRALMWSALRGSNRQLEAGQHKTFRGGLQRALIGWMLANAAVGVTAARSQPLSLRRLRYEDFVADPGRELRSLGQFLELDVQPVLDHLNQQRTVDPGHGVGGNRMRRQGPIRIRADEEWKQALPGYARGLAILTWPLAQRYGYNVWRMSWMESASQTQIAGRGR
jgi:hypothetical protein